MIRNLTVGVLALSMIMLTASVYVASAHTSIPDAGEVNTVAGNGSLIIANGVSATSSGMYPTGVAVDSMGNFYIANQNIAVIQEVTVATGMINTVAGNGQQGCTGDGGAATSAKLNQPLQVAVDAAGNIYIADDYCHSIRKVTRSTGIITTVVGNGTYGCTGDGGPATSAQIDGDGVAVDSSGNIYAVGYGCEKVRKIDANTGIITTVAGNGSYGSSGDGGPATSASLGGAIAVAIDGGGNLYIATYADNRVRKVNAATGIITTVAGNGTSGFSGDGGPATLAELYEPQGVAVDPSGNLYIADTINERVRFVNSSSGVISTFAGNGAQGFSGDGGAATSAKFYWPDAVALDLSGNVYIGDQGNHRIRAVGISPVNGYLDTKLAVLTIGYPPPGHASTETYTNNSTVGTSISLNASLAGGVTITTTNTTKTDIGGVSTSGSGSASQSFTAEADTSYSNAVTQSITATLQIPGVLNDASGVDHGKDQIFLWVNPKINLTTTSSPSQLLWNGYAYDTRDTCKCFDYFYVTPYEINGTDPTPTGVLNDLQRSWDPTLGAITTADLQTLEVKVDPFVANPSYNPSNDPNARYDEVVDQNGNALAPLLYEPPSCPGTPDQTGYNLMYSSTTQAGQGVQVSYGVAYTIDTSTSSGFNVGVFNTTVTNDLNSKTTLTLTGKFNHMDTLMETQGSAVSITGPSCSANYRGDIHMQVWKDNSYGTFMLFPVP